MPLPSAFDSHPSGKATIALPHGVIRRRERSAHTPGSIHSARCGRPRDRLAPVVSKEVTGAGFDQLKQLRVSGISGVAVVGRQAEPQQQANAERCQGEYVYQRQHPRP
jgi:hypothetical protein